MVLCLKGSTREDQMDKLRIRSTRDSGTHIAQNSSHNWRKNLFFNLVLSANISLKSKISTMAVAKSTQLKIDIIEAEMSSISLHKSKLFFTFDTRVEIFGQQRPSVKILSPISVVSIDLLGYSQSLIHSHPPQCLYI